MRLFLALLLVTLAGCAGARVESGPAPTPVGFEPRVVLHASGSGDFQSFIGIVPFSAAVRWAGNGTIEARLSPTGVTVYADGDSTWTVTPVPGLERDAEHAVQSGELVIRRNGMQVGLSRPASFVPAPAPKPISSLPDGEIEVGACHGSSCCVK